MRRVIGGEELRCEKRTPDRSERTSSLVIAEVLLCPRMRHFRSADEGSKTEVRAEIVDLVEVNNGFFD